MASFFKPLLPLAALLALAGCNPALNWREVRPDNSALTALLPCKPDKATKTVPLGGKPTELTMLGCEAGGATFAVAVADIGDAKLAADVLQGWQSATLSNMRAPAMGTPMLLSALKVPGASAPPQLVTAQGLQADGKPVASRAAYFSRGSQVFQAVIYAAKIDEEAAETFFSGLKLQ